MWDSKGQSSCRVETAWPSMWHFFSIPPSPLTMLTGAASGSSKALTLTSVNSCYHWSETRPGLRDPVTVRCPSLVSTTEQRTKTPVSTLLCPKDPSTGRAPPTPPGLATTVPHAIRSPEQVNDALCGGYQPGPRRNNHQHKEQIGDYDQYSYEQSRTHLHLAPSNWTTLTPLLPMLPAVRNRKRLHLVCSPGGSR
jgi:hypothetical protein